MMVENKEIKIESKESQISEIKKVKEEARNEIIEIINQIKEFKKKCKDLLGHTKCEIYKPEGINSFTTGYKKTYEELVQKSEKLQITISDLEAHANASYTQLEKKNDDYLSQLEQNINSLKNEIIKKLDESINSNKLFNYNINEFKKEMPEFKKYINEVSGINTMYDSLTKQINSFEENVNIINQRLIDDYNDIFIQALCQEMQDHSVEILPYFRDNPPTTIEEYKEKYDHLLIESENFLTSLRQVIVDYCEIDSIGSNPGDDIDKRIHEIYRKRGELNSDKVSKVLFDGFKKRKTE